MLGLGFIFIFRNSGFQPGVRCVYYEIILAVVEITKKYSIENT